MELSIIIVNYNTKELTQACLASIDTWKEGATWEVIVVDNGSTDGSVKMLENHPGITVIRNKKNQGFARANNQGIRIATGRYILLLNSDAEIRQDTIDTMLRFMDGHPKAGAASCKLLLASGGMDPACHRGFPTPWASLTYMAGLEKMFPRTPLFAGYHMGYKDMTIPHQVDCISGAFFFVRKKAIADAGVLDEDYFFYAEDIDWAYRMKKKGWEIWFNPEAVALHKKKQSGRASVQKNQRVETEIYFHSNNWLFYRKHFAKKYGILISAAVNVFYSLRLFMLKTFSL